MVPQSRSRPQDLGTAQPPWKTFSSNHLSRRLGQQMLGIGCMHQRGHLLWQRHCHHSYDRRFSLQSQILDRMPPPVTFPSMATKHQLFPAFALSTYLTKPAHLPHKNTPFVRPKSGRPLLSRRLFYWIAKLSLPSTALTKVPLMIVENSAIL